MAFQTDYEKDKREIEELMLRFLPYYMEDLRRGAYKLPEHTEQSLRHIFTMGAMKGGVFLREYAEYGQSARTGT